MKACAVVMIVAWVWMLPVAHTIANGMSGLTSIFDVKYRLRFLSVLVSVCGLVLFFDVFIGFL
jgi:ABC-type long-subunit fatty acid transport system fused permease/ATPase subunit